MADEPKAALRVERRDCYELVKYVRSYAWELRALSRLSWTLPFEAVLLPVFLCMLLAACTNISSLPNIWWVFAVVPGIVLLGWAALTSTITLVRKIRDRRMEVRVVRNCLERLTSVADTLTDLSFAEAFMLNIALNDARTALEDCPC